MTAVSTCFRKYCDFSGRASRAEFWWFVFFVAFVSSLVASWGAGVFGTDPQTGDARSQIISSLFQLATFLPLVAAASRRMHDSGRRGRYILLPMMVYLIFILISLLGINDLGNLISPPGEPIMATGLIVSIKRAGVTAFITIYLVSLVLMLWWMTRRSEQHDNRYGPIA
ncbi:DUF805 domain-containing protein [Rhizobium sp. ZPR3]|uniref:DUF805 domain-containing protein n=1 Tax=unclassified Rhizobium TaxID=2613769 RepID=UPI0032EF9E7C